MVTANLLGAHHVKTVNTLTDNNPTFNAVKIGEIEDDELLLNVVRVCEHWWIDQEQQHILEESVSNGETYGTVAEKVSFNPDLEYPLGEVETETIDLFNIGWYPVKCRQIQKAEAVLHFWAMSVREARRKWPDFANQITPDDEYIKNINDQRQELASGGQGKAASYITTISNVIRNLVSSSGRGSEEVGDETVVVEMWLKDYSTDDKGEYIYPGNIRRIQCGCCGMVVFSDTANPSINPKLGDKAAKTYLFDKFPFSLTQSVTDPASAYGMADYEQLEGLNVEVNKTISQITMVKDKGSRLKLINPMDTGVPNSHFTNFPGIIRPATSMSANSIKYLDPPKLDPTVLKALDIYKDFFFIVAGSFDLESAHVPGREVIAYKAIAALLENVARMLRGKERNYSKMTRERGRMFLSHAQNWYTEERWVSYSDKNGAKATMSIKGDSLILPAKLTVVSGSTMPKSQVQKREEAITLYKENAIDNQELLKTLDWSDYMDVIKRMAAGPLGAFFEILLGVGVPEELLQYFQELSQMDEKDIEKAFEQGSLPTFPEVINTLLSGGDGSGHPPPGQESSDSSPVDNAEVEVKQAQVQKTVMESNLIQEKIVTERVNQQVMIKGVVFDEEKLKIERAKVAADIKTKLSENKAPEAKDKGQGPFRDKSLKSDNKK
ncbi:MAG: hypothetical protein JRD68_13620 [Deltaproteobacteria bacterium]|nr:hypothetical protein [Deltaproteobacteria bacterium]